MRLFYLCFYVTALIFKGPVIQGPVCQKVWSAGTITQYWFLVEVDCVPLNGLIHRQLIQPCFAESVSCCLCVICWGHLTLFGLKTLAFALLNGVWGLFKSLAVSETDDWFPASLPLGMFIFLLYLSTVFFVVLFEMFWRKLKATMLQLRWFEP